MAIGKALGRLCRSVSEGIGKIGVLFVGFRVLSLAWIAHSGMRQLVAPCVRGVLGRWENMENEGKLKSMRNVEFTKGNGLA